MARTNEIKERRTVGRTDGAETKHLFTQMNNSNQIPISKNTANSFQQLYGSK